MFDKWCAYLKIWRARGKDDFMRLEKFPLYRDRHIDQILRCEKRLKHVDHASKKRLYYCLNSNEI